MCVDFTCCTLQINTYDLFTIIGSTLNQIGKNKEVFHKTHAILKPGGKLYVMNFKGNISLVEQVDIVEEFYRTESPV